MRHVKRRDGGYIGGRILKMELLGRRKEERFMDLWREDMQIVGRR